LTDNQYIMIDENLFCVSNNSFIPP